MTNCFCCASNIFKQPDYYNDLCTAVKFTLKLRKKLKILRCLSCTCFVSRGSNIYFHYLESLDKLLIQIILLKTLFTVQCRQLQDDGARQLIVVISNMHDNPCYYISFDSKVLKEAQLLSFRGRRRIQVSKEAISWNFSSVQS